MITDLQLDDKAPWKQRLTCNRKLLLRNKTHQTRSNFPDSDGFCGLGDLPSTNRPRMLEFACPHS